MDKSSSRILAEEWFARAHDDELSCKDILKDREGAPNTVCFLSQQLAEKYLKGYLVYREIEFPKIHQLDRLIALCKELDLDFSTLMEDAAFLTTFYVTARYPGDYPTFSWEDAERAFAAATRIQEFVEKKVG